MQDEVDDRSTDEASWINFLNPEEQRRIAQLETRIKHKMETLEEARSEKRQIMMRGVLRRANARDEA